MLFAPNIQVTNEDRTHVTLTGICYLTGIEKSFKIPTSEYYRLQAKPVSATFLSEKRNQKYLASEELEFLMLGGLRKEALSTLLTEKEWSAFRLAMQIAIRTFKSEEASKIVSNQYYRNTTRQHALKVIDEAFISYRLTKAPLDIVLAAVLHDIAKPHCIAMGKSLLHHAEIGAKLIQTKNVEYGCCFTALTIELIRMHGYARQVGRSEEVTSDKIYKTLEFAAKRAGVTAVQFVDGLALLDLFNRSGYNREGAKIAEAEMARVSSVVYDQARTKKAA